MKRAPECCDCQQHGLWSGDAQRYQGRPGGLLKREGLMMATCLIGDANEKHDVLPAGTIYEASVAATCNLSVVPPGFFLVAIKQVMDIRVQVV
eukprot:1116637-Karenia_brevis.AAC.1